MNALILQWNTVNNIAPVDVIKTLDRQKFFLGKKLWTAWMLTANCENSHVCRKSVWLSPQCRLGSMVKDG